MPVKTDKKPVAKKPAAKPVKKQAAPAPKAVEKPKAEVPKAQAPKMAPKAEPKVDKKKTISAQEFHNLAIERSYEIWQERSKSGKPGDQNSDWDQAVAELRQKFNVK